MPVLTTYKGLDVVEGATGAAGIALTDDFMELADRAPLKSVSDPAATDDADAGYFPGSLWFNTATETMWVCTDATADAAVWKSFYTRSDAALTLIPEETAEAVLVGGDLGVGITDPKARLHGTGSTIVGADDVAVADADLGAGEVNFWLDETVGAEKFGIKAKLSGGTVKSGEVSLDGGDPLATAVILSPATSARNTIAPTGAAIVPLTLKGAAGQGGNLTEWRNSNDATLAHVTATGTANFANLGAGTLGPDNGFPGLNVGSNTGNWYVTCQNTGTGAGVRMFAGGSAGITGITSLAFYTENGTRVCHTIRADNGWAVIGNGVGSVSGGGQLHVVNGNAGFPGLIVQAAASQSAHLQQWRNSGGTPLSYITSAGNPVFPNLPTSDPSVAGALWNDSGTVKVSAG